MAGRRRRRERCRRVRTAPGACATTRWGNGVGAVAGGAPAAGPGHRRPMHHSYRTTVRTAGDDAIGDGGGTLFAALNKVGDGPGALAVFELDAAAGFGKCRWKRPKSMTVNAGWVRFRFISPVPDSRFSGPKMLKLTRRVFQIAIVVAAVVTRLAFRHGLVPDERGKILPLWRTRNAVRLPHQPAVQLRRGRAEPDPVPGPVGIDLAGAQVILRLVCPFGTVSEGLAATGPRRIFRRAGALPGGGYRQCLEPPRAADRWLRLLQCRSSS